MTDAHLGERIHDLLDNRLTSGQVSDAMAHLDACADCRLRWDDLRAAREALRTSSAGIDMTFARQLLDRERMAEIARGESKHVARAAARRGHHPLLLLMVLMAILGASVGILYSLGKPQAVAPAQTGATPSTADAADTSSMATVVAASSVDSSEKLRDWSSPPWDATDLVPVESRLVSDGEGGSIYIATVLSGLDTIVITEQRGRLADDSTSQYSTIDLGHATAYVTSSLPQQLVWQSGDIVTSASCTCARATLAAVAASFPTHDPSGILDRVFHGAERIANAVAGQ